MLGSAGEERRNMEAEFEVVVRSLRLGPGDTAFQLVPPKGGGGLDGVYTHLKAGVRPNAFGGMDVYAKSAVMVFEPSGLYGRALPAGAADLAAFCRAQPTECGTYRVTGGGLFGGAARIELTDVDNGFGVLERKTEPLERNGADLKIGGSKYRHVPPLAKGARLDGVWRYVFASSGSTPQSSGSVAAERFLTLAADGRFTRKGWSGVTSTGQIGNTRTSVVGSNDTPLERGRYEFDGYRLLLTGEDDRRETLSVFRPEGESDDLLVIDGANYLKQKSEQKQ
jgi:hypothetical protein